MNSVPKMLVTFRVFSLLAAVLYCVSTSLSTAYARRTNEKSITSYEGKRVEAIVIEGNRRIEKEAILEKIRVKKGRSLKRDDIREDIRALYEMRYFDEIEVQGENFKKGVRLFYKLRERPVISKLSFEGNEQVSTDDLKEVIKVKEWSILDINRVRNDIDLIQKHYEEKGFYLAKVRYKLKPDEKEKDRVELSYVINDYDKVQIKKITFLNNSVYPDSQLKGIFQETKEGGLFSFISGSGNFKDTAFNQDLQRMTYWYLDNGYVKFRYENPVVTVSDDKRWLYISVFLEEGEPYTMGELDFSGDLLFPNEELKKELTLEQGDLFRISRRNLDIQKLTEKYQDLGYAFVNVIPKMKIHDDTKKVDITYHFEKGNLVYFGEVIVSGNSKTHDKVIRRELRILEGQLYSGSKLRKSRERVERLGYFQPGEVIFNTKTRKGRDDLVDLEIKIKERSTGSVTVGAGYGSFTGFFLTAQVSEINLFGRGQILSLRAQYANDTANQNINLGFTEPYTFDTRFSTGGDLFWELFPLPRRATMRRFGFDARVGYPLTDELEAFVTYKRNRMIVQDKVDPSVDTTLDEGILSSVVWSMVRDVRNNRFETTDGNYQRASIETAGIGFLGGDKTFVKWTVNNRFYKTIIGDLVFRNSTEVGRIHAIGGRGIPPTERFFLGGPQSMKGFDLYSLGPSERRADGSLEYVGGTVEMFSLFELEYPLIKEAGLKAALFYDIGNAFLDWPGKDGVPFTLRQDYGFGIRWFSPIGPLRFEWAFPVNVKPGERAQVFQFFIGPPF